MSSHDTMPANSIRAMTTSATMVGSITVDAKIQATSAPRISSAMIASRRVTSPSSRNSSPAHRGTSWLVRISGG
jgi:hypothetical protein